MVVAEVVAIVVMVVVVVVAEVVVVHYFMERLCVYKSVHQIILISSPPRLLCYSLRRCPPPLLRSFLK